MFICIEVVHGRWVIERVTSLCLWVWEQALTVICAYVLNCRLEYAAFFPAGVLEGVAAGDSFVMLGDFNVHMSSDSVT